MPKNKNIFYLLIFCLLLPSYYLFPQNPQYKFRHITANEGLSAPSIYSVIKDKQGFIWLATGIGLYRYDGYDFKQYRSNPSDSTSLSGDLITGQLFIDRSGDLWVGTKDNGLNRFNISKESFEQYVYNPEVPGSLSHNNTHKIIQDKSGTIWIATLGGGLNKFDSVKNSFLSFLPEPDNGPSNANFIQSLIEFDDESLLVGTRKGLYKFNKFKNSFSPFSIGNSENAQLRNEIITDIIRDDKILWIGTENGLVKYSWKDGISTRFQSNNNDNTSLSSNFIRQIVNSPDKKSLWISTVWGLNRFDKKTLKTERFLYISDDPNSLGYNMLWGMYIDNSNLLWIGTDNTGINLLNLNKSPFYHHKIEGFYPDNEKFSATVFCEDNRGDFWIGTFGGGLWQYDINRDLKEHYAHHPGASKSLTNNNVFSLCEDSDGVLWVGTFGGGVNKFDKYGYTSLIIEPDKSQKNSSSVIEIAEDQKGVIWLGTLTGLYNYDKTSGKGIENISLEPLSEALIRSICVDRNNNLWIGTHSEGLFKRSHDDSDKRKYKNYRNNPNDPGSINSDIVMSIYEDYDGNIWIATSQGLNRYIPDKDQFESYDKKTGLEADYLYHIQGRDDGVLWISSSKGLMRFDPKADSNQMSRLYEFQHDVLFEDIYPYSFYLRKNGEICVGGKYGSDYGYYTFHPDSLKDNTLIPHIAITRMLIRNEPLQTDSAVIAKRKLVLKHDQNFFSFEFAALDYTHPEKNQYAYYLDGFEDDWNYIGNRRFANYTGIPPGEYIFRVKGSNNDGYWNENGISVAITILPPPWKTWCAYLLYALLFITIITIITRFYLRRQRLLYELELEHQQTERLAELDKLKSDFFANISHEFRTPLTLILGPLKQLISKSTNVSDKENLSTIKRNAVRLQNLISQLLNLSKLEAGKLKLKVSKTNIVELISVYIQSFESLARQNNITLEFLSDIDELFVYVDKDKMVQIMNNLLSNAFKYTDKGGIIKVQIKYPGKIENVKYCVEIRVSDTGRGIPADQLKYVFDRFYQVEGSYLNKNEGTGIGLALCKELVELHYGTIQVQSKPGGSTAFTIKFPIGKDHLKKDEIVEDLEKINTADTEEFYKIERIDHSAKHDVKGKLGSSIDSLDLTDLPVMLIVEDNSEMRNYISGFFEGDFYIVEASDGEEGIEEATDIIPDIIISDVMMPGMDGYAFCKKIKSDERCSHIPVILLTARASKESRIEGLETGADDFITKPFDGDELHVRVRNLIQQRRLLSASLKKRLELAGYDNLNNIKDSAISLMDEQFLTKAITIVKQFLSNPEFDIELFCRQISMSRMQLHRKLKALTGQATGEFIRSFRLKQAAILLHAKTGTITEIAYDVGFTSPSYFTECFSKQFGLTPSEFIKNQS